MTRRKWFVALSVGFALAVVVAFAYDQTHKPWLWMISFIGFFVAWDVSPENLSPAFSYIVQLTIIGIVNGIIYAAVVAALLYGASFIRRA